MTSIFSSNCAASRRGVLDSQWAKTVVSGALILAGTISLIKVGSIEAMAKTVGVSVTDSGMSPPSLTVVQGTELSLNIVNRGTRTHNFVIPDFYIFTQNLQPGETVSVSFTPDKTGRFQYYSDTGGKPEPGISGMLQVQAS